MEILTLFFTFMKIGLFTIGGGYAMIPLIQDEVLTHGWLTQQQFIDFIAVAESTPGPFAINIATFVGMESGGVLGALATTSGVVLPSFGIILLVAKFFLTFRENRFVQAALSGLRPTVIGLIIAAAFSVSLSTFFRFTPDFSKLMVFFQTGIDYRAILLFAILFTVSRFKKLSPIVIILSAGGLGVLLYGVLPLVFPALRQV